MQTFSRLIEAADTPYPLKWRVRYKSRHDIIPTGYYMATFVGANDIEFLAWANETATRSHIRDARYRDGIGREWQIGFRITDDSVGELAQKYPHGNIRAYAITGLGDAFRVMATAVDFLKYVIAEDRPVMITFTAEDDEPSRQSLYARMLRRVSAQIPGYRGHESYDIPGHYMIFRGE